MVNWTPEKHQIIVKEIFKYNDIKVGKEFCQHLAELIGEDCTPKAIQNVLSNLKKYGKASGGGTATPTKAAPAKTKSAKSTPSKTPGSARGRTQPKKSTASVDKTTNDDSDGSPSPSAGRKRAATADGSEDSEGSSKKLKKEEFDDVDLLSLV